MSGNFFLKKQCLEAEQSSELKGSLPVGGRVYYCGRGENSEREPKHVSALVCK